MHQKVALNATKLEAIMNNTILGTQIGSIISRKRKKINVSQAELGAAIGVTKSTVSRYEKGTIDIPISKLPEISNYCKFPMRDYFSEIETEKVLDLILYADKTPDEQSEAKEVKKYLFQTYNAPNLNKVCAYYDLFTELREKGKIALSNEIRNVCIELIIDSIPKEMSERLKTYFEKLQSLSD